MQIPGVSAKELYSRGLNWFNTFFKNPSDVIRETDSVKGKISGKARFKIYNEADKSGLRTDAGNTEYTIKLETKDGKYRYIFTDINWKQASYYPAERWLDTKAQSYKKVFTYYLEQTDSTILSTSDNLESFMKAPPVKKKDDW